VKTQDTPRTIPSRHQTVNHSKPLPSREEAGRELAKRLNGFSRSKDTVILALPEGGVTVAAEIAEILHLPLDILLIGKISLPTAGNLGAITSNGVRMLNIALIDRMHLSEADINAAVLRQLLELARKERLYRGGHRSIDVADHTVILVDDGTTPCSTMRNAVRLVRRQHAERIIVATPAACHHAACDLRMETDDVIALAEPKSHSCVGSYFKHFPHVTPEDVRRLLDR
jgi:putative phosphoribosyl transferase